MEGSSKRLCAILFADIAGSTRLYETLGDEAAKTRVTALQQEIVATAVRAGGKVQEIVGDEVMLCFVQASDAAACALAIQRNVASLAGNANFSLAVRIGLHWGQVIIEGDRMFGDTINVAARVTAIAQGGQIITTQAVVDRLSKELQQIARRFDVAPIKGKREPLLVYDIPWQTQDLTMTVPAASCADAPKTLALVYADQRFALTPDQSGFSVGRDSSSDLIVSWPSVSRRHAVFEFVRGRFVLSDTSSNGTYLLLQDGEVVFLRRESLPLWGKGRIALGAPLNAGTDHSIDYCCG
ncbi:MAG: adenylate/guanylate cyclase domain-containing protein [Sedimenticolaceae bacterium]